MSRQKPKRNKTYKPKYIRVPVMPELQREFMMAGHGALAALRLAPSVDAFEQLAGVFNVIGVALLDKGITSVILESGMRALIDVANRSDRTGKIAIGKYELRPIELAMLECETLIKELDLVGIEVARRKIQIAQATSRPGTRAIEIKEAA